MWCIIYRANSEPPKRVVVEWAVSWDPSFALRVKRHVQIAASLPQCRPCHSGKLFSVCSDQCIYLYTATTTTTTNNNNTNNDNDNTISINDSNDSPGRDSPATTPTTRSSRSRAQPGKARLGKDQAAGPGVDGLIQRGCPGKHQTETGPRWVPEESRSSRPLGSSCRRPLGRSFLGHGCINFVSLLLGLGPELTAE